ncbi:MAG: hypothetical protein JWR42_2972, partial [Marmoricola sp.]|nr:hypothetical protein [Marmoricola sp.]
SYADATPTSTSSASYLVDPVFTPLPPSISVVAQDPPAGATDVPRRTSVRVWFDNPIASGATLTVSIAGSPIPGSTSLSSDGTRLTFDPSATLPAGATVSVQLSGVVSTDGASLTTRSWSFTTSSTDPGTQQSLFSNHVPTTAAVDESSPVELGTRFTPGRDGQVSALRFFKGTGNGGTHVGTLWSDSGSKLASVTFTGETPSGWQTAKLSTPVSVTGGTSYVVSYLAPQGHYATTPHLFDTALVNGDLTGPGGANGRYLYGAAGGFPTDSYGSTAYFVDVVFVPTPRPLTVVAQSPAPASASADLASKPSVSFSAPLAPGWSFSVSSGGSAIAGSATLSADGTTLTFTPAGPLPADRDVTVSVKGLVSTEGSSTPDLTWTFHTVAAATTTTTLFGTLTPTTSSANDGSGVELGVSFTSSSAGSATGVRFYKGTGNGGTHAGTLWAAGGTRLATVTFTGETASGWQQASFASPVALTAGTTYVVSYYAPRGHYAVTGGFFSQPWVSGPLTAPGTGNGRYRYGSGGVVPTSSYNGGNYFVDVLFRQPN